MEQTARKRSLLFGGALLILIGLFAGAAVPAMATARLGLAAHLAGVQGGILVMVLAFAWPHLVLDERAERTAFVTTLLSNYTLYAALQLAAVFGTSRSTPIAGSGTSGSAWQEALVEGALYIGAISAVVALCLVVWGLRPGRTPPQGA
jgi:hydroxylaminobenzene mutase